MTVRHSTVATTNAGLFRAMCSCGWESGEDRTTKQAAYRDKALHDRTHTTEQEG